MTPGRTKSAVEVHEWITNAIWKVEDRISEHHKRFKREELKRIRASIQDLKTLLHQALLDV